MSDMYVNPKTGLVAIETLVSEAGFGIRKGEIRGVAPEVAESMVAAKHARALSKKEIDKMLAAPAAGTAPVIPPNA